MKGKKIIVGVTGSIAAYKAAVLVRGLVKEGAEVRVVMTPLAKEFVTPLTMATLSKNPIAVEFFNPENGDWNSHVALGEWADALLVAPATANTIAKMACGVADNLLLTTYLSAKCPVFVAPAMDLDMYCHSATQRNIETLRQCGNHVIEPESGELASGLCGKGRMAEPETIIEFLRDKLAQKKTFAGKKVMITAGGTVENIDPVRYISNYSTGKMGFAIAEELAARGAEVTVIKARTDVCTANPDIKIIEAFSAEDMYSACMENFKQSDIAIMNAAVADYTPRVKEGAKIKKASGAWPLELVQTKDIAAALGAAKGNRVVVGFALETENGELNAAKKMEAKNLDLIVLNSLGDSGAGFGHDTNKITILGREGLRREFSLKSKAAAAKDIADAIEKLNNF